jgi:hypothetical protein
LLSPVAGAQQQTTSPGVNVKVYITLTGSKVIVTPKVAPRGSDALLIVHNVSRNPQRLAFDYKELAGGVHTGFNRVFKPGERQILVLFLDYRAALPYYSGPSFAGSNAASRGIFLVGPQCTACLNGG